MKCTIQSIADKLDLSRNTVARVLSGKEGVSAKTRKLVLKKAEEMGYHAASPFLSKKTLPDLPESIVFLTDSSTAAPEARAAVMQAADEYIKKQNFTLILAAVTIGSFKKMSDDSSKKELQLPAVLYSPSVRGVIMMNLENEEIYHAIAALNLPVVVVNSYSQDYRYAHFSELQTGRIDFLSAYPGQDQKQLGTLLTETNTASVSFVSNQNTPSQLLENGTLPDYFLCEDDWTAIRLIHAAQSYGYSVPQDFSVIGCGNIPESAHIFPSLTTIQIPWKQMGTTAARCITDRIREPELSCVSVRFTSRLIKRSSALIPSEF